MVTRIKSWVRAGYWRFRSVPIFYKTIGLVAVFAGIFGAVFFVTTGQDLSKDLHELWKERVEEESYVLAEKLALPANKDDFASIHQLVDQTMEFFPDISYIIVRGDEEQVIAQAYDPDLPLSLEESLLSEAPEKNQLRVLDDGDCGLIFEASHAVAQGLASSVQIGLSDQMIRRQLGALTGSTFSSLGISVTIGILLGLFLTFLIVQPIKHLKGAAVELTDGKFDARSKVFSDDEIGQLAVAFNEMAASLQQYRQDVEEKERVRLELIERVVSSHEDERKKISRELHDDLGQSLLATLMDIRSRKGASGEISPELESLETQIEEVIDEVNHIISGMRPSVLDHYGIDQALESYLQEFSERYDIEVIYKFTPYDGFDRLPSIVEISLYRIVQEALSNIVKYASASHVSILLIVSNSATTLLVEDDGIGFDPESVRRQDGVGLVSMHERATLLGGAIDFESKPGQGTTIRVTIPNN